MKLILAIVSDDDARDTIQALVNEGFRCTKLSSTGGFLRAGNTTILCGVVDADVDKACEVINQHCHKRIEKMSAYTDTTGMMTFPFSGASYDIEVGGATVFVLDVVEYHPY